MIRSTLAFFLILITLSCAKPNYQSPPPLIENQKQDLDGPKCKLFFEFERLCFEYKWITQPSETEMGSLEFKFYVQEKPNLAVVPIHKIEIILWMPSMAHGSRPVVIKKNESDTYTASKIFFIMPGVWEIRFQLKEDKNVIDQVVEKITI